MYAEEEERVTPIDARRTGGIFATSGAQRHKIAPRVSRALVLAGYSARSRIARSYTLFLLRVQSCALGSSYTYFSHWFSPTDIALLVMDKCTQEKSDRDDVSFEISFDYEFVEDFYVERPTQQQTTPTATPTNNIPNVFFSGGGRGLREGEVGGGEETEVVELRDVTVVEEGKVEKVEGEESDGVRGGASQSGEDAPDIASSSRTLSVKSKESIS